MNPGETVIPNGKHERMNRMRKIISERMHQSSMVTAPVTIMTEVEVSGLVSFRKKMIAEYGKSTAPSYNAVFVKAVGEVLAEHPGLNCSIVENDIVYWDAVNIGVAMDTPRGLVVPVVRNVNQKSLADLTMEIKELSTAAISGKLLPDQFLGGTFTITNLGSLGIDFFTPIINYPEVGILGIGRMRKLLELESGQMIERIKAFLSLTFDHRAIDGAPAAQFLKDLRLLIESKDNWL